MTECLNCHTKHDSNYCPECGQHSKIPRLTMRHVLGVLFDNLFFLDGRLPRTIRKSLLNPGRLSRNYIGGQRIAYTNPLTLYLFISGISFLIFNMAGIDMTEIFSSNELNLPENTDDAREFQEKYEAYIDLVFSNPQLIAAINVIPIGLFFFAFFHRDALGEIFVFVMYVYVSFSIYLLPVTLILLFLDFWFDTNTFQIFLYLNFVMPFFYWWGIVFFRPDVNKWLALVKTILIFAFTFILVAIGSGIGFLFYLKPWS